MFSGILRGEGVGDVETGSGDNYSVLNLSLKSAAFITGFSLPGKKQNFQSLDSKCRVSGFPNYQLSD